MDSYAAGLIDGEGCIGVYPINGGGNFLLSLSIGMSDKGLPALERMANKYGGKVRPGKKATSTTRQLFTWGLSNLDAAELIRNVRPALLVKAEIADIALSYWAMTESAPRRKNGNIDWSQGDLRKLGRLYVSRSHEANRKGPDPKIPYPNRQPLAIYQAGEWWNPTDGLFGPEEFIEKFPRHGRVVGGRMYEMPEPNITIDTVKTLPTPRAADSKGSMTAPGARRHVEAGNGSLPEVLGVQL